MGPDFPMLPLSSYFKKTIVAFPLDSGTSRGCSLGGTEEQTGNPDIPEFSPLVHAGGPAHGCHPSLFVFMTATPRPPQPLLNHQSMPHSFSR